MVGLVEVLIPVDAVATVALNDERKREAIGALSAGFSSPIRTMPPCSRRWNGSAPTQRRKA